MPSRSGSAKIQRWIDLLAALLARNHPATIEQIFREVPDYHAAGLEPDTVAYKTARRKFERDKDELRGYGIPIETRKTADDEVEGYVLDRREFYLPYLSLHTQGGSRAPRKPTQYGYAALRALTFDADELAAVAEAARRVRSIGDPELADAARSAMRKLAFDLPVDAAEAVDDPEVAQQPAPERATFERLADALSRHKRATFRYRSMHGDATADREVEPYGLFFVSQQWYLAAREPSIGTVKNFRLSRMTRVQVNTKREQNPDYTVPDGFQLREHARSRQAWELGDAGAIEVLVRVESETGAAAAAAELGEPVEGNPNLRRLPVRRPDAFARWLLSFGGELRPLEPPDVVERFRRLVEETLALYGR
ncbi:MAG: helix-turn-helix transcriptional regulator [Gemmatimonadales bacterium]